MNINIAKYYRDIYSFNIYLVISPFFLVGQESCGPALIKVIT